jgi:hypothetical protein
MLLLFLLLLFLLSFPPIKPLLGLVEGLPIAG